MARQARQKSATGIYHTMFRGNNKQYVFNTDTEKQKLLECIEKAREKNFFNILAYCIMDNHIHILIKESTAGIGNDIRRITRVIVVGIISRANRPATFSATGFAASR
jgi:REP element-mobilizing transposase RayT